MSCMISGKILGNEQIAPIIYKMTIESEYIAENARAGQFVNVKCSDGINALLRRPISICNTNRANKSFNIVYQVKGTGTELLSKMEVGDYVDILGPLGNSFDLDAKYSKIAVVGGGIGIFPLLFLLSQSKAAVRNSYLGFRSRDFIVLEDEFKKHSDDLHISTDDGSTGDKGLVTDLLQKDLEGAGLDMLYACGPTPMLKQVVRLAEKYDIPCQVSMEQRMGCGIGACLVCACKTRLGDEWEYSHICKDGPVFKSSEIIFED